MLWNFFLRSTDQKQCVNKTRNVEIKSFHAKRHANTKQICNAYLSLQVQFQECSIPVSLPITEGTRNQQLSVSLNKALISHCHTLGFSVSQFTASVKSCSTVIYGLRVLRKEQLSVLSFIIFHLQYIPRHKQYSQLSPILSAHRILRRSAASDTPHRENSSKYKQQSVLEVSNSTVEARNTMFSSRSGQEFLSFFTSSRQTLGHKQNKFPECNRTLNGCTDARCFTYQLLPLPAQVC